MDLDSFLISILFDNTKTQESARKIENVINGLKDKIVGAFVSISSIDFLKNAIESSIKLATKMDNLTYITNINKESLNAWGEAVKRTGGTAEGFYSSISNLSDKIREIQTNFGSPGQLAFARLGLNLRNSNGEIKNAVELLGEIGEKFKTLPKVWQLNLGQQLGLDSATIRLLSDGNEEVQKLVANMIKLGQINQVDTEKNIKLRNSLYDISLVFDSIKLKIGNDLIPVAQKFSELFLKALQFLQEHSQAVRIVLLILTSLLSGIFLSSLVAATRAIIALTAAMLTNPIFQLGAALFALGLIIEDLSVYLRGGKSAFEDYYKWIENSKFVKTMKEILDIMEKATESIRRFFGLKPGEYLLGSSFDDELKKLKDLQNNKDEGGVKDKIAKTALEMGIDPSTAATIANIESGFNPNAKNPSSSASGLFQLTDETAQSNGISDLSKKNDLNQKYLGEYLGLEGAKKVLSSDSNTMLSNIFSSSVLKANPQFQNMTSGQLINNANKTFEQKSITLGDVNINAPNANAQEISKKIAGVLQQHLSSFVTNIDNGVRA